MLDYRTEQTLEATVVRISGEIDLSNARVLELELEKQAANNHLIVDLAGVEYLDMSGVKTFTRVHAVCQARRRLLVLTSPSLMLRRLFDIIDLRERIAIFDSREEAHAYLLRSKD